MKSRTKLWFSALALALMAPGATAFAQLNVSLTFDDGLLSATTAQNLLDAHGMKGTFYIISGLMGTDPTYYLPLSSIQAIATDGHEIGGHTITHPDLTTLTAAQQQHEICDGRAQLIADGFSPNSFAYPYGNASATTTSIVKSCYNNGRGAWCNFPDYDTPNDQGQGTCVESIPPGAAGIANGETVDDQGESQYWMDTEEAVSSVTTLGDLQTYVQNGELMSASRPSWVILQFHFICADTDPTCGNGQGITEQYGITVSTFTAFLDWLKTQPVTVEPVGQVMGVFPSTSTTPAITGLTPSTMTVTGSSQTLTVNGVNFLSGATVNWNGTAIPTTYVGVSTLTAQVPATDLTKVQITTITVTNPGGATSPGTLLTLVNPVPVLTTLSSTYTVVGSTAIILTATGSDFVSSSTVRWNGSSTGIVTTFISTSTLSALIPATDLSTVKIDSVTVFNPTPGGGISTTTLAFTVVNPVPVLTTLSSTFTLVGSPTFSLTLSGSNFVSSSTIHWNGAILSSTTFVNNTTLKMLVPASTMTVVGISSVTVFNPAPGGGTSSTQTFTVGNPPPTLVSLSTNSAMAGSAALPLTVTGTKFVNGSYIQWSGVTLPTTFVSSTSLTTTIPVGDLAVATVAVITVTNPAPGGATSAGLNFTVNNPIPVLTALSSTFTIVGNPPYPLTVTGSNFVASSVIQWNGSNLPTTYISNASLTTTIPAGDLTTVGPNTITVFNSAPGGGITSGLTFTVVNPMPVLTALSSTFTVVGSSAFSLNVTGSNFVGTSVIYWNGLPRTTTFINGTQLSAQILSGDLTAVGAYPITVVNPVPGGGTSSAQTFTVGYAVPAAASLSPNAITVGANDFTLTVNGSNFYNNGVSTVKWNGSARTTTFNSATQLTALIPASDVATIGQYNVTVFNSGPGGGTSTVQTFTVGNPVPVLTAISPTGAVFGSSAFTLTVTGSNFVAGSIVQWNGSARATTFVNSTSLTAQIPASDISSLGISTVTVFSPAPVGGTSAGQAFTAGYPVPGLTALLPNSAIVGSPAFDMTVNGSNFVNAVSVVQWNGLPRATTYLSSTQLTAHVLLSDLSSVGASTVTVVTSGLGGGTSPALTFTVDNALPVLNTISSSFTVVGGPAFILTVTGSNFVGSSVIQWNGQALTTSGNPTSTLLSANVPATDLTSVGPNTITVFTPAPGGGVSANALTFTVGNPIPGMNSLSLSPIPGSSSLTLTVTGSNFVSNSVVQWSGSIRTTTFINSTTLSAVIQATDLASASSAIVTVFNPLPGGGLSNGLSLASGGIASLTDPTLTGVTPTAVLAGAPDFTMTVTGTNFASNVVLEWNGVPQITTIVSATELTAAIPASLVSAAGSASVTVVNLNTGGHSTTQTVTIGSSQVRVHPNPWRANVHAGQEITFDELPADSTIKIFTTSAHWVKTLSAPAGSATWDLKNDSGDNVASGYYIYLVTNPQGKSRGIVAIIR